MIKITGIDLVEFVKKVYELSSPQGLGALHFDPQPLSDEEASSVVVSMDYVRGRACKMDVHKEGDDIVISDSWYDHTDSQLKQLLDFCEVSCGPAAISSRGHGRACNCESCNSKKRMDKKTIPSPN